jgi:hypothetical protein
MDGWNPYFEVSVVVFTIYVLLAVFGSRKRGRR